MTGTNTVSRRPLAAVGVLLVAAAVGVAFGAAAVTATAPGEPISFYGGATDADGDVAAEGTVIVAAVDGTEVDRVTVDEPGVYAGDGPTDEKLRTHTQAGDTVTFHVGSVNGPEATETHDIGESGVFELDLTFPAGTFEADSSGGGGGGSGGGGGGASPGDDEQTGPDSGGERITVEASFEEEASGADGGSSVRTASVSVAAAAGSTVDIDLTGGTDDATNGSDANGSGPVGPGASVEGVEIDVAEDVDVDLEIRQSADPPSADAQELVLDDGTEPAGYVQIVHDFEDDQVEQARIDFRMTAAQLDAADAPPEDVVLYHYDEGAGEWEELPTEVVEETGDVVRFRAVTDSFSEFAAGIKRPRFEIVETSADTRELVVGDGLSVAVRVRNTGGAQGTFTAELQVDSDVVAQGTVTIPPNETARTVLEHEFSTAGSYDVRVNDVPVDEVEVVARADDPAEVTDSDDGRDAPESTGVPFDEQTLLAIVAVAALLGGGLLVRRRR